MSQSFVTIPSSLGNVPLGNAGQQAISQASSGNYLGNANQLSVAGKPSQLGSQLQSNFAATGKPLLNIPGPSSGGGTPDTSGIARSLSQAQQYFGSQFNNPNMPPTTNSNGSDTEFGQLIRIGKDR